MIDVKSDAIKAESVAAIRQMLINTAICIRVVRETCGEDLNEWFAEVGKDTFEQINEMDKKEFDEFVLFEKEL